MRARWTIGLAALVLLGGAPLTADGAETLVGPSGWSTGAERHELVVRDGRLGYRGPLAPRAERPALDRLLADGPAAGRLSAFLSESLTAAVGEADGALLLTSSADSATSTSGTGAAIVVPDLDGDGIADVATLEFDNESWDASALLARSGATGATTWSRPLGDDVFGILVGRFSGESGFMIFSARYEERGRLLRSESTIVLELTAVGGDGRHLWTSELRGTMTEGIFGWSTQDLPDLWAADDVTGGDSLDVVVSLESRTWRKLPARPVRETRSVTPGIVDGDGGALHRLSSASLESGELSLSTGADLDGDGKAELYEVVERGDESTLTRRRGDGTSVWSAPIERGWFYPYGAADFTGDGGADLLAFRVDVFCEGDGCYFDFSTGVWDGGTGALVRSIDDAFPTLVGDLDGDGKAELQYVRGLYDEVAGTYGFEAIAEDVTGKQAYALVRTEPLPTDGWEASVGVWAPGDVQSDGAQELQWEMGSYLWDPETGYSQYVKTSDGRIDGRTASDLMPIPAGWGVFESFDGSGHDYFEVVDSADPAVTMFAANDGLGAARIWQTPDLELGEAGGMLAFGDLEADGRSELLVLSWGRAADGSELVRLTLVDGGTGTVRWQLDPDA